MRFWTPSRLTLLILVATGCTLASAPDETLEGDDERHHYITRAAPTQQKEPDSLAGIHIWSDSEHAFATALADVWGVPVGSLSEFRSCKRSFLQLVVLSQTPPPSILPKICATPVVFVPVGSWSAKDLSQISWFGLGVLSPVTEAERFVSPSESHQIEVQVLAALHVLATRFELPKTVNSPDVEHPPFRALSNRSPTADLRDQFYAGGDPKSDTPLLRLAAARGGALLIDDSEPWVRSRALMHSRSHTDLLNALDDGSSLVRVAAIQRMLQLSEQGKSDDWRNAFVQSVGHSDAYIRWKGAYGLRDYPDAVPVLINLLWDPDIDVQREAAQSLGRHSDPTAIEGLKRLAESSNSFVRRWATAALADYRSEDLRGFLESQLLDKTRLVALEAHRGLLDLGLKQKPMAPYQPPSPPKDEQSLTQLLQSADATVRKDALKFLLANPVSLSQVAPLLEDPDSDVRKLAATVLGWAPNSQPLLTKALFDVDPDVVAAALLGLSRQPLDDISPLLGWTNHPDTELRLRAVEALSFSVDPKAAEWLKKHAKDSDERIRAAVVHRLPHALIDSESSILVRCEAMAAGAPTHEDWCPHLENDWGYFGRGVFMEEDRFLHEIFSWNSPHEQPSSYRLIRPPVFRRYGHPDHG